MGRFQCYTGDCCVAETLARGTGYDTSALLGIGLVGQAIRDLRASSKALLDAVPETARSEHRQPGLEAALEGVDHPRMRGDATPTTAQVKTEARAATMASQRRSQHGSATAVVGGIALAARENKPRLTPWPPASDLEEEGVGLRSTTALSHVPRPVRPALRVAHDDRDEDPRRQGNNARQPGRVQYPDPRGLESGHKAWRQLGGYHSGDSPKAGDDDDENDDSRWTW